METASQAFVELQDNLLVRQPQVKLAVNNSPMQVRLFNDQLSAGDCIEGSVTIHPAISDQVKKVTLTVRGSSPTSHDPKLSLFWIEVYTIYVSTKKSRRLITGDELVIPFSQALPSSASSKRVREAMAGCLIVEVEWMQGAFLQYPVSFSVLPSSTSSTPNRSRAPSPYPPAISRTSTSSSSSSLKKRFWPFG